MNDSASAGVSSIAKSGDTPLTGAVTLSEGSNITLTQVGQDIEIASTGGGGGGDVYGPASATDNAVALFDTTTGKLLKNSRLLYDNSGDALSVTGGGDLMINSAFVVASGTLVGIGGVNTDTIDEFSSGSGVDVDGVLLKDGAINTVVISGSSTPTLLVSGTSSISGTNTGDQTTITGNAGSATILQTGRTIGITGDLTWTSPSFNGSTNITAAGTLATVNSNVGSFTNANITVNGKGLITAASSGTAGDVVGPASSVDNTVVRFDLTTGKLIQGSNVTISDGASPTIASTGVNLVLAAGSGTVLIGGSEVTTAANSQTLSSKTLTTPTIASFANATHDHSNAAGGGQLTATTALNATGTPSNTTFLRGDNTWSTPAGGGTVTSVSVVSANGLAGSVATSTTTPAITLSTTITGILKGNGIAISAATSGTDYAPATSGSSILYGNGSGGFSNATVGSGLAFAGGTLSATAVAWSNVTGTTQAAAVNNGYITNNAGLVTVTLPSTAAVGSIVEVAGSGAGGWRLAQNASQLVNFGVLVTTTGTGGRLDSVNRYDAVRLICIVANTTWSVISSQGNISVV